MSLFLSLAFFAVCAGVLWRLRQADTGLQFQMGLLAAFSIGYFCLPVMFAQRSGLDGVDENRLAYAIAIFLIFFVFVLIGVKAGRSIFGDGPGWRLHRLDAGALHYRVPLACVAFGWFIFYSSTYSLTSYSSTDFEAYFADGQGSSAAIASLLSDLAVGWIVVCVALAWREGRRLQLAIFLAMLAIALSVLLLVGQRLAFIAPIVTLIGVLGAFGDRRRALQVVLVAILALGLVSPVAVAVRTASGDGTARDAVSSFDYGDSPTDTILQSILDRGDLLFVSASIVPFLDREEPLGWEYYSSVIVSPVPSQVLGNWEKPYLLSSNGEPSGEISILAWRQINGDSTGSLSAFGGIVAYRELGWLGVILNGLAAGMLFAGVYRFLGRGGVVAVTFYGVLFVDFTVRKVPPSFWEALASVASVVPVLVFLALLSRFAPARAARR